MTYFIGNKQKKVGVVLEKYLGQIRSNFVKKVKKLVLSIGFFHALHAEYLLKQKAVVVQTPEGQSKANIARNSTFEGH